MSGLQSRNKQDVILNCPEFGCSYQWGNIKITYNNFTDLFITIPKSKMWSYFERQILAFGWMLLS